MLPLAADLIRLSPVTRLEEPPPVPVQAQPLCVRLVGGGLSLPLFGPPNVDRLMAKGDFPGLINALEYQGLWRVRRDAAVALTEMGDTGAVEPLLAALQDDNASVRIAVIGALGRIGGPAAVEPLTAVLTSQAVDIRKAAADSLGLIGDSRALEPLIACLKDASWSVRRAAAEALGQIRDARAADSLNAASEDPDANVRRAVADALAALGRQSSGAPSVSRTEGSR
jgi:HEAT repeat protein